MSTRPPRPSTKVGHMRPPRVFEPSRGGDLDLPLIDWEGHPYFTTTNGDQFAKAEAAGWDDPSFFPIGVFLGKPDSGVHPASLAAIGVNTYMGCEHNPPITNATDHLFVVAQSNEWTTGEVGSNADVVGWFVHDEPDLNISLATYQADVATVRARDDGRFVQTNYAHGILRTHWWNADQGGGQTQMDIAFTDADLTGVDQYCYTSPGIGANMDNSTGGCATTAPEWPGPTCDDTWTERAAAYGWCVDQLRSFDGPTLRPQVITIETKMPFLGDTGRNIILYEEIEASIFSALAHEARGIMYFQHNGFYDASNGGPPAIDPNTGVAPDTSTYSLVDCETELRDYVQDLNARIMALAPVINTQSMEWDFGASNIDTMLKQKDGFIYIFASQGFESTNGSKTFTLPSGVSGTVATVIDESRTVNISAGQFSDTFSQEYSHHVYRVEI